MTMTKASVQVSVRPANKLVVAACAVAFSLLAGTASATPCIPEPTDMSVAYSDQITCANASVGDTDLFRFTANAGDRILAEAVFVSGASYIPFIKLMAPDGTLLGQTWGPARLDRVVNQTGTFTAIISGLNTNTTGSYAFTVSCTAGSCVPTPPPPPAPPPGSLVQCSPEPVDFFPGYGTRVACDSTVGDSDLYRFQGGAGDRVLAEAVYLSGTSYNPFIYLIAPNGTVLGQTWGPARLDVVLPAAGVYTAVVVALNQATPGQYAFTVSCTGGSCLPPPGLLPRVSVSLTGCTTACAVGVPFKVQATLVNPSTKAITAELKMGLRRPDGTTINVLGNKHLELSMPAGLNAPVQILNFLWPTGLPSGTWTFEATAEGPDLGDTFSRQVKTFTVVP